MTNIVLTPVLWPAGSWRFGRLPTATLVAIGLGGLALAVAFMLGLHLAPTPLDPMTSVMSDYANAEGIGWMFGAGLLGVAIAAGAVAACLARRLADSARGLMPVSLWLVSASAAVAGMFPTDEELPLTVTGQIHRYGAVTMLCAVPVAGMLAAARLRHRGVLDRHRGCLLATSAVMAVVLAAFLIGHLEVAPTMLADAKGLLQRLTVVLEVGVLAQLLVLGQRLPSRRQEARVARANLR